MIDALSKTISDSDEPSLVLNNHCIVCEYRIYCKEKAKADDNLSLMDRATNKMTAMSVRAVFIWESPQKG